MFFSKYRGIGFKKVESGFRFLPDEVVGKFHIVGIQFKTYVITYNKYTTKSF